MIVVLVANNNKQKQKQKQKQQTDIKQEEEKKRTSVTSVTAITSMNTLDIENEMVRGVNNNKNGDSNSRPDISSTIQKKTKIQQIALVLSNNYVLTFEEEHSGVFDAIYDRIREKKGKIRLFGADYLVYAILDVTIEYCFVVFERTSVELEKIEDELFRDNVGSRQLNEIHRVRRKLVHLRRAINPMSDIIKKLSNWHNKDQIHIDWNSESSKDDSIIKESTLIYFRDVLDSITQAKETLNTLREISNGLLDLYLSRIQIRTNEVMKVLAIISTIFVPLTFIAGIYGMNFENMPILKWKYGYQFSWVVMGILALTALWYFKRKNFI